MKRNIAEKVVPKMIEIFSEPKLKHILWSYLENKGYEVAGEVEVLSSNQKREIKKILSKEISYKLTPDGYPLIQPKKRNLQQNRLGCQNRR